MILSIYLIYPIEMDKCLKITKCKDNVTSEINVSDFDSSYFGIQYSKNSFLS